MKEPRNITSAKLDLKRNTVEFRTLMTPLLGRILNQLKLNYVKREILEFETREDAELYFYEATKELRNNNN